MFVEVAKRVMIVDRIEVDYQGRMISADESVEFVWNAK
jgi:hypothetical protein